MRTLRNSFISIYTPRGFKEYAKNALAWRQWRASWIFPHPVSVVLPADMPTPSKIADIHGQPSYTPVGAGRSGFVSGTDDEAPSNEDGRAPDATSGEEFTDPELGMRP